MKHVYTIELLYHFLCCNCNKWWSIGDFNKVKQDRAYCPHCGCSAIIEQLESNKDGIDNE